MSVFLQISDFDTGHYKLALNDYNELDLQDYIDSIEENEILQLFGLTLGRLVYDNPNDYTAVTDAFQEEINGCLVISLGVTKMLRSFVYFNYIRDQYTKSVVGGVARNLNEQSTNQSTTSHDIYSRYNEGVDTWKAIQMKCLNDSVTYDIYKGYEKKYVLPF
jgi:hypothetical protein